MLDVLVGAIVFTLEMLLPCIKVANLYGLSIAEGGQQEKEP